MANLFKICESIAMLDMLCTFAHLATGSDYVRPKISDANNATLAIQSCRHPIKEKVQTNPFVPNDVYATPHTRFQIITGCNMSGKSTYIRTVALVTIMAQVGSFVPAASASLPITHQLFARTSTDSSVEANVSTFAAEMREMAFILHNIDRRSMAIVDELGRGTSTRDGLAIAIAVAEALIGSGARVWFTTHFRDLAKILAERAGVVNLHLAVDISRNSHAPNNNHNVDDDQQHAPDTITMKYSISQGAAQTQHYGLALAKLVPLPPAVLETAETVAHRLKEIAARQKSTSSAVILAKRRKLLLSLKEHLEQASNGALEGEVLREWLKELQGEFVRKMEALNQAASEAVASESAVGEGSEEDEDGVWDGGEEMDVDEEEEEGQDHMGDVAIV
jgi:DNA mismatch repair protein MSH4